MKPFVIQLAFQQTLEKYMFQRGEEEYCRIQTLWKCRIVLINNNPSSIVPDAVQTHP